MTTNALIKSLADSINNAITDAYVHNQITTCEKTGLIENLDVIMLDYTRSLAGPIRTINDLHQVSLDLLDYLIISQQA